MERGCIRIINSKFGCTAVETELVNCTLWVTKHEIADLFNVFVSTIDSNLKSIFKSDLLYEEDVTRIYKYENNGRQCEMTLYNLDVLICVSYRIASFEAKVFREWVMKALTEYLKNDKRKFDVFVVLNSELNIPDITSLN